MCFESDRIHFDEGLDHILRLEVLDLLLNVELHGEDRPGAIHKGSSQQGGILGLQLEALPALRPEQLCIDRLGEEDDGLGGGALQ